MLPFHLPAAIIHLQNICTSFFIMLQAYQNTLCMKTQLFLLLFVFAAIAGMAQNPVQKTDSSFTSADGGATFSLNRISEYTYDAACRNETQTYRYFDVNTHNRLNTTRYIYHYNNDNTRNESIFQILDTLTNTFVNNSRDRYTFGADGYISSDTSDQWNGSQWVPDALFTYDFATQEQRTLYLQQKWDANQQAYINYFRITDEYNTGGKVTQELWEDWNGATRAWDTRYDNIYVFDTNNFVVSDTFKTSYGSDTLQLIQYNSYSNNSKGYPDSSVFTSVVYNTVYRSFFTYYPDSVRVAQEYRYDYDSLQNLTGINRTTHSYDSTADGVYAEKHVYAFANSYSDPFVTVGGYSLKSVYSPGRLLASFEYAAFQNDPDGIPIYNYVFKDTLLYEPCGSVLPVSLLSFTANKKDNNAVLQWRTSSEANTASFAVQRSLDGIHFTTIGTVKAAGNSNIGKSYSYTDFNVNTLGASKLYYRLAQQDVNGAVHNSAIAQVDIANGKLAITLSPNPVRNSIGIYSPVAMTNAVIRIADMSGKTVYASHTNLSAGTRLNIDASAFAKGVYFVTVQSGTDKQVMKLVSTLR